VILPAECNFDTYECDYDTLECDYDMLESDYNTLECDYDTSNNRPEQSHHNQNRNNLKYLKKCIVYCVGPKEEKDQRKRTG
jgi:hypothetical protein